MHSQIDHVRLAPKSDTKAELPISTRWATSRRFSASDEAQRRPNARTEITAKACSALANAMRTTVYYQFILTAVAIVKTAKAHIMIGPAAPLNLMENISN